MNTSKLYKEVAGIIGGVGPEATNYFVSLLIKFRQKDAKKDQDHIPFLVFNNPQIPDRSAYFAEGKENPLPELIHTGKILKDAGATFLVIPCNGSCSFIDEIKSAVGIDIVNMIELTAKDVATTYGNKAKVGLLATDATLLSGIYQREFAKASEDMTLLTPDSESQKKVMDAIYDIKKKSVNPRNIDLLKNAAQHLTNQGASVIILGCTEIPLAFSKADIAFPIIDPMELTAKKVIDITIASEIKRN